MADRSAVKIMFVVTALLSGIVAGIGAAILARADGASVWSAILRGGSSFGTTVGLILAMASSGIGVLPGTVDVLMATVVGLATGCVSRADGVSLWTAIVRGGIAFGGTVGLALLVQHYAGLF